MKDDAPKPPALRPLNMTCTTSLCEHGLHCFLPKRRMRKTNAVGPCRSCSADLVNWKRLHRRDIQDIEYLYQSLQLEAIRNHYWRKAIDTAAMRYAREKGRAGLRAA